MSTRLRLPLNGPMVIATLPRKQASVISEGPERPTGLEVEHVVKERGDRVVPIVIQAGYPVIGATVISEWRYGTDGLKVHEGVELIER